MINSPFLLTNDDRLYFVKPIFNEEEKASWEAFIGTNPTSKPIGVIKDDGDGQAITVDKYQMVSSGGECYVTILIAAASEANATTHFEKIKTVKIVKYNNNGTVTYVPVTDSQEKSVANVPAHTALAGLIEANNNLDT